MSYRSALGVSPLQGIGLAARGARTPFAVNGAQTPETWARNPSWPALPTVTSSDQKVVGLHAVFPDSNFLAFTCAGAYTVDWGDGSTENVATGVTAYHQYDYNDADLANTNAPVTLTDAGDLVGRTGHGHVDGNKVQFWNIASTTGLTEGQIYYVINASANDFQVSLTLGGSAVALTTDGTATLLRYKVAQVTITPQGGSNLTSVNLHVKHNQSGLQKYTSGWLDLTISGPNFTASGLTIGANTQLIAYALLERVTIKTLGGCTNLGYLFSGCWSLQDIPLFDTSAVTSFSYTFAYCHALQNVAAFNMAAATTTYACFYQCLRLISTPDFNLSSSADIGYFFGACPSLQRPGTLTLKTTGTISAVNLYYQDYSLLRVPMMDAQRITNGSAMFAECWALTEVPNLNFLTLTNATQMFYRCESLVRVPPVNMPAVTNATSMFQQCTALLAAPFLTLGALTNATSMFQECRSLREVPLLNLATLTNATSMFNTCAALTEVPLWNTAALTNMSNMFVHCDSLREVPLWNTANVTTMFQAFEFCYSLQKVPLFNTASVTDMTATFAYCYSLVEVPLFNTAACVTPYATFYGCSSLQSVPAFNFGAATNPSNLFYQCVSLTDVPKLTVKTTGTVNMEYMFYGCLALRRVPWMNTVAVTNMQFMFFGCYNLESVPAFNTSAVTNFAQMFNGCASLQSVPALDTAATTVSANLSAMFTGCTNLAKIEATNLDQTFSVASCKLSKARLEALFGILASRAGVTITVTGNYGVDTAVTKSGLNTTAQSAVVNMADTSGLSVGMLVTGSGLGNLGLAITSDVAANTFGLTGHGLPNGTPVSFSNLSTTTGLSTNTIYYVVNAAADTFQVALTVGGAAINLTGSNGTPTLVYMNYVQSIVTNTSVTLTTPAKTTQTGVTHTFRLLDAGPALLKGWAVTF